ncbi:Slit-like 3 protein [Stylophora pistillata]|uniref:Slit-like 3 protein n=1 Tax=Stylophora pistillata TaxID=50429 RepID=A0A2B4R4J3_STYPI|nr:Slit-like 3 protein [Stylophora pistillata]
MNLIRRGTECYFMQLMCFVKDLSNNELRSLPPHIFRNITAVEFLKMDYNKIERLHEDQFQGLVNLSELDIFGNEIQNVSITTFSYTHKLRFLHVSRAVPTLVIDYLIWLLFTMEKASTDKEDEKKLCFFKAGKSEEQVEREEFPGPSDKAGKCDEQVKREETPEPSDKASEFEVQVASVEIPLTGDKFEEEKALKPDMDFAKEEKSGKKLRKTYSLTAESKLRAPRTGSVDNDQPEIVEPFSFEEFRESGSGLSSYEKRHIANIQKWDNIRRQLYDSYMEECCFPTDTTCVYCLQEPATLRCQYGGPKQYFCLECGNILHSARNHLHVFEKWKEGMFTPYVVNRLPLGFQCNCGSAEARDIVCIDEHEPVTEQDIEMWIEAEVSTESCDEVFPGLEPKSPLRSYDAPSYAKEKVTREKFTTYPPDLWEKRQSTLKPNSHSRQRKKIPVEEVEQNK